MRKHAGSAYLVLVTFMLVSTAIGRNPACSVLALALLLLHELSDQVLPLFKPRAEDPAEARRELERLKQDLQKVKAKQDQDALKSAFQGVKNG